MVEGTEWVVGEPDMDQSGPVETNIITNYLVGGLLWFLFVWEIEDIFKFIKKH